MLELEFEEQEEEERVFVMGKNFSSRARHYIHFLSGCDQGSQGSACNV